MKPTLAFPPRRTRPCYGRIRLDHYQRPPNHALRGFVVSMAFAVACAAVIIFSLS